jgi:hypothetical protein
MSRTRVLALIVLSAALLTSGWFAYDRWSDGGACRREFGSEQESDAYDVCLLTGADRHSVCDNMENSPFMCSAGFVAGQADIVADRELGLAREREDCADAKGVTGCSGEQWDDWCGERYTQYFNRRILERCLFARP